MNTNMTWFRWIFKNSYFLDLWTKVASAWEGLKRISIIPESGRGDILVVYTEPLWYLVTGQPISFLYNIT